MKTRNFQCFGLALALSVGTVGALMSAASITPATAQAAVGGNHGGGNPGGGNAPGGNSGDVSAANSPARVNARRPVPPIQRGREKPRCEGHNSEGDLDHCIKAMRKTARVVEVNGHPNCAIVQTFYNPTTGAPEFYCLRKL